MAFCLAGSCAGLFGQPDDPSSIRNPLLALSCARVEGIAHVCCQAIRMAPMQSTSVLVQCMHFGATASTWQRHLVGTLV